MFNSKSKLLVYIKNYKILYGHLYYKLEFTFPEDVLSFVNYFLILLSKIYS